LSALLSLVRKAQRERANPEGWADEITDQDRIDALERLIAAARAGSTESAKRLEMARNISPAVAALVDAVAAKMECLLPPPAQSR
jgi:hypothetical protein